MLHTLELNSEEFSKYIVAQDDDNDYQESGYVVLVFPHGMAAIARYSHCSCYSTWEALSDGGKTKFDWTGSLRELIEMAFRKGDPVMPERLASSDDYDYNHLCEVYRQVLEKYPLESMMLQEEKTP